MLEVLRDHLDEIFGPDFHITLFGSRLHVNTDTDHEVCTLQLIGDVLKLSSDLELGDPDPYGRQCCFLLADPGCLQLIDVELRWYKSVAGLVYP